MEETIKVTEVTSTPKKKRVKKPKSTARKIIEWVLFGVFGAACAFILAANISGEIHKKENYGQSIRFGVGSFIVLTDSMEPEIPKDSAIITYKENISDIVSRFNKGQKVDLTFMNTDINVVRDFDPDDTNLTVRVNTGKVMTHRLREIHINEDVKAGDGRYYFVTAGINEKGFESGIDQYQVFTEKEYLGTVKINNVFLGKVFNFIVSPIGLIILLLIPAAYLIITSSIDIFKTLKASEASESTTSSSGDVPEGGKLASVSAEERERLKKELLDEMIKAKKEGKKNE